MTEDRFIHRHLKAWRRLEELLSLAAKRGCSNMDFNNLKELDRLYRQASSQLSYAQTYFPDSQVCGYLNGLVSRGHNHFYTRKRGNIGSVVRFYIKDIPRIIMDNWGFIAVSFGVFLAASLFSFAFTRGDIKNAYTFLPDQIIQNLNIKDNGAVQWDHPLMAGLIMSNNILVSLKAFAYGISMGLGTIYILLSNGFLLGSLSALATQESPLIYWSLILPHGIIELSAIFISGAAGLKMGYSLIRPGAYRRRDSLMISGKEAIKMMGIVIPMLVTAGVIEGFLTPSSLSPWGKLIFAALTAILITAYFALGIRKDTGR